MPLNCFYSYLIIFFLVITMLMHVNYSQFIYTILWIFKLIFSIISHYKNNKLISLSLIKIINLMISCKTKMLICIIFIHTFKDIILFISNFQAYKEHKHYLKMQLSCNTKLHFLSFFKLQYLINTFLLLSITLNCIPIKPIFYRNIMLFDNL